MFLHVTRAEYIAAYRLHVWFNDNSDADVDLADSLNGPIFDPLRNVDYFKKFRIEGRTVAWPIGADFAPEYLRDLAHSQANPV